MKKIIVFIITVLFMIIMMSISLSSCISTRDTMKINMVEIGMTKSDIQHLLGTPLFKNADENVEEWGYHKMVGEIAGPEQMLFIVTFDSEGKVIAYNSAKEHPSHLPY